MDNQVDKSLEEILEVCDLADEVFDNFILSIMKDAEKDIASNFAMEIVLKLSKVLNITDINEELEKYKLKKGEAAVSLGKI